MYNYYSLFFICLGPCAKHPACILLGLECQYVLMRNDRDFMVNFEPGQYIYKKFKHISPRCRACKPNLHHFPTRGKTIILQMTLYVSIHSCICPVSISPLHFSQLVSASDHLCRNSTVVSEYERQLVFKKQSTPLIQR